MRYRLSSARKPRHSRSRHSSGSGGPATRRNIFDPAAAPLTGSDATWAIEKAREALSGVKELLAASQLERFG
jgi:hypothetical protein